MASDPLTDGRIVTPARDLDPRHPTGKRALREALDLPATPPPLEETTTRVDAGPIAEALGFALDRLDLIEHNLGDLDGVLMRLGYNLRPVLEADGDGVVDPPRETMPEDPSAVDRRSTIARRIAGLGHRAEDLASIVSYLAAKVEQLDANLELKGVDA